MNCQSTWNKFVISGVLITGSLSAMRFVTAVQEREANGDKQVEHVSRELWKRIWSEDKDITKPESLAEVSSVHILEKIQSVYGPEGKKRLKT